MQGTEEKPTASPAAFALEVLAFESAPEHIKQQHRAASARHFQGQVRVLSTLYMYIP